MKFLRKKKKKLMLKWKVIIVCRIFLKQRQNEKKRKLF